MAKSKIQAIVSRKCPSCREGDIFTNSTLSTKFSKINKRCKECNATFEPETGFYFGAMYVSYGINVALMFATLFFTYFIFDPENPLVYIFAATIPMMVFMPFIFRLSRSIYLHLFGGLPYRPKK
ncbi:DUF983 domain-containing protein [Flammeovirga pectinis]|uniref:DUF983 domain-containing protein n=1 Tax=Flammeovirga pectinis TaxID=2494373 RepID=A0A3Q9FKW5_9BACT|nr:DUF983 domain-containing protein [Flammeovirga pectinis]AZQ62045.1 DUF983 domain-containing protein [Flammeovirga pectinis]